MTTAFVFGFRLVLLGWTLLPVSLPAQGQDRSIADLPAGSENNIKIDPAVAALFTKAIAAYRQMRSYAHTEVTNGGIDHMSSGFDRLEQETFKFEIARPNRFSFRSDQTTLGPQMLTFAFCDGLTFATYHPLENRYIKTPAPATFQGMDFDELIFPAAGCTSLVAWMFRGDILTDEYWIERLAHAKVGPTVREEGKRYDTVVEENKYLNMSRRVTFFFDAASHLLHKTTLGASGQGLGITANSTLSNIQVNQPLPAATFTFHPSVSVKRVVSFVNEGERQLEMVSHFVGASARDFAAKERNGKLVSLSSLKGKVVVLDFWASWCGPCAEVMPILQEISNTLSDQGVVVLTMDTSDTRADCDAFLKDNPQYTMTVLIDPGETDEKKSIASRLYFVNGIPTTVIIDREGVIRSYAIGAHERGFYRNVLKQLGVKIAE